MLDKIIRNISIRKKVLVGFGSALVGMIVISVLMLYGLHKIKSNFEKIELLRRDVTSIIALSELVSDLKRNVSVYLSIGQSSIDRKIKRQLDEISNSLKKLNETSVGNKKEYKQRIQDLFENYKITYNEMITQYRFNKNLTLFEIPKLLEELENQKDVGKVFELESLIWRYHDSPTRVLSQKILKKINEMGSEKLYKNFLSLTQSTKNYMYLVNVVMAGQAYEFEYISNAMKFEVLNLEGNVKKSVERQNKNIKNIITILIVIFILIMFYNTWMIAKAISIPIREITKTLDEISSGNIDINIPEQDRKDEIGTLSRAAETFRERSQSLVRTNEELSHFAYRTSHDLKAPLLSIIGIADIIKEDLSDKDYIEVEKNIEKISSSAKKLDLLIRDILNLSRADHLNEVREECSVQDIAKDIEIKLRYLIKIGKVNFDYDQLGKKFIKAHKLRLTQVLENLISNAIKYADPNKENPYVKISIEELEGNKVIIVKDNGLGIEKKYHKDLFGMFKRFHSNISFGSGLGLYLVSKHLEKMNADIIVESKIGEGTIFKIIFS